MHGVVPIPIIFVVCTMSKLETGLCCQVWFGFKFGAIPISSSDVFIIKKNIASRDAVSSSRFLTALDRSRAPSTFRCVVVFVPSLMCCHDFPHYCGIHVTCMQ